MIIRWISKINIPKTLLVATIFTLISTVIHQLEAFLTLKYYLMPEYFGVWSRIMMPLNGSPPVEFFITSLILTFVTGVGLTFVYYYLRDYLPSELKERMFMFADLLVGLQFLFFTLPSYLLFNLPPAMLIYWFVGSFVILVLTSYSLVKIIK